MDFHMCLHIYPYIGINVFIYLITMCSAKETDQLSVKHVLHAVQFPEHRILSTSEPDPGHEN